MSIRKLDDTIVLDFVTIDPDTGALKDAVSTSCDVFEDAIDTIIVSPAPAQRTVGGVARTGHYRVSIVASAANGFEVGKCYNVYVGVSVRGSVSGNVIGGGGVISSFVLDAKRITDLQDLSSAGANAACDTALADYDAPTAAELTSVETNVRNDIAALNDLSSAQAEAAATAAIAAAALPTIADVKAQAEDALQDIHLDEVIKNPVVTSHVADSSALAAITSKSTPPTFSEFPNATASLMAIADAEPGPGPGEPDIKLTLTKVLGAQISVAVNCNPFLGTFSLDSSNSHYSCVDKNSVDTTAEMILSVVYYSRVVNVVIGGGSLTVSPYTITLELATTGGGTITAELTLHIVA